MVRPIYIGTVFRLFAKLIPEAVAEARAYLYPLQVGCGFKCGADAAVHEACRFVEEFEGDPRYNLGPANAEKSLNRTIRGEILKQTAEHAPFLIRPANVLYAKRQTYLRLRDEVIRSTRQ